MNSDSVKIGAGSFLQRTTEVFPKYLNRHATSEGGGLKETSPVLF